MTSTAMALSKIGGTEIDPAQMDEFLDNHEGYDDQDRLYWQIAASKIGHTATFYNGYIARHRTVVDDELDAGRSRSLQMEVGIGFALPAATQTGLTSFTIPMAGKLSRPSGMPLRRGSW